MLLHAACLIFVAAAATAQERWWLPTLRLRSLTLLQDGEQFNPPAHTERIPILPHSNYGFPSFRHHRHSHFAPSPRHQARITLHRKPHHNPHKIVFHPHRHLRAQTAAALPFSYGYSLHTPYYASLLHTAKTITYRKPNHVRPYLSTPDFNEFGPWAETLSTHLPELMPKKVVPKGVDEKLVDHPTSVTPDENLEESDISSEESDYADTEDISHLIHHPGNLPENPPKEPWEESEGSSDESDYADTEDISRLIHHPGNLPEDPPKEPWGESEGSSEESDYADTEDIYRLIHHPGNLPEDPPKEPSAESESSSKESDYADTDDISRLIHNPGNLPEDPPKEPSEESYNNSEDGDTSDSKNISNLIKPNLVVPRLPPNPPNVPSEEIVSSSSSEIDSSDRDEVPKFNLPEILPKVPPVNEYPDRSSEPLDGSHETYQELNYKGPETIRYISKDRHKHK